MQSLHKVIAVSTLALAGAVLMVGCGKKSDVVATVNGRAITTESYMSELERQRPSQAGKSLGEMTLEKLATDQVILSAAEKEGVMPTDEDVAKDIKITKFQAPDIAEQLKNAGMSEDGYKQALKVQAAMVNLYSKGVSVSQKEIDAEYKKLETQQPFTLMRASWIVVGSQAEAQKVLQMLSKGASFRMVAQEKSLDPATKAQGGAIPLQVMSSLPPEVQSLIKTAPVGKDNQPLKLKDLYVVVRVTERAKLQKDLADWMIRKNLLIQKASKKQKPADEYIQALKDKAEIKIERPSVSKAMEKAKAPGGMPMPQ